MAVGKRIKVPERSEGWKERERQRSRSCPLQSIELLEKPSRGKPSSQQHPRKTHRHMDTHTHTLTVGETPVKAEKLVFPNKDCIVKVCVCVRGERSHSVAWHDQPFIQ